MSEYSNDMRGAIWSDGDRKSDKHPHFKGSATINNVEYWVSAWKRDPAGNPKAPALRFSFQAKDQQAPSQAPTQAPSPVDDFDDDIGF